MLEGWDLWFEMKDCGILITTTTTTTAKTITSTIIYFNFSSYLNDMRMRIIGLMNEIKWMMIRWYCLKRRDLFLFWGSNKIQDWINSLV
jgi:hypothetical protein